ncbi:MAG: serpin family protein [Clostridiales bacterium]|nr:serpin family protein [Clostridiales bacterium]
MKEKKIFDAITNVRDELIEEARETKSRRKVSVWKKSVAVAASISLIIGLGLLIPRDKNKSTGAGAILDVIYPQAYAFEDYDTRRQVREQNPVEEGFIEAINGFSYKTGAHILAGAGRNVNYSPLSLYFALSLAAYGAEGDTEEQLLELLGVFDKEVLAEQCGNFYRTLYRDNEIGKLKIANSIWMDHEVNGEPVVFKNDFVRRAAENFYASSHSVDFSKDETGKEMADWILKNTNGTLSPSIEINPEQMLSIINTVYYYDQWIDRFDMNKTSEDVFYLSNGGEVKADFMNRTNGSAGFNKGEGFTRAGLGLKNAGQMVFILPDEGVSPYELMATPEKMKQAFEGGEGFFGEVVWKIPRFSFGSKLSLTDTLKNLGVNSAFTTDADFSGITDQMAFITDVLQETHIAIDEDGVEASAFTQINYIGAALPEGRAEMILDRPFIYGITAQDGTLLFVGVCENPSRGGGFRG